LTAENKEEVNDWLRGKIYTSPSKPAPDIKTTLLQRYTFQRQNDVA